MTLKHCLRSLENNVPEEDVQEIVMLVNTVHDKRMLESDDPNEDDDISMEEFEEVVSKIEKKNCHGQSFRHILAHIRCPIRGM